MSSSTFSSIQLELQLSAIVGSYLEQPELMHRYARDSTGIIGLVEVLGSASCYMSISNFRLANNSRRALAITVH